MLARGVPAGDDGLGPAVDFDNGPPAGPIDFVRSVRFHFESGGTADAVRRCAMADIGHDIGVGLERAPDASRGSSALAAMTSLAFWVRKRIAHDRPPWQLGDWKHVSQRHAHLIRRLRDWEQVP